MPPVAVGSQDMQRPRPAEKAAHLSGRPAPAARPRTPRLGTGRVDAAGRRF
ncbi:hypothetical protein SBRY_70305 [Actinacidiphila bryophytorum]|uniref:Uncharacterized protein n=1 Tax=Actinacidiphila bryophytorum TaxID=1436133 RepID=A0A9W4MHB5_9ACTN|nr:hypothetical protein SBRY_70305 [Actinacidiphila bryophytorum]